MMRCYFSLRRFAFFLLYLTASNSVLCLCTSSYISGGSTRGQYHWIMAPFSLLLIWRCFLSWKVNVFLSFPHAWHRVRLFDGIVSFSVLMPFAVIIRIAASCRCRKESKPPISFCCLQSSMSWLYSVLKLGGDTTEAVSYTHLRAHET